MKTTALAGTACLILAAQASSQIILGPETPIQGGGIGTPSPYISNKETAGAVRRTNSKFVALAWNHYEPNTSSPRLFCSLSTDGLTFTPGFALPGIPPPGPFCDPGLLSVDPGAAASADGQVFLSGLEAATGTRLLLWRIAPENWLPELVNVATPTCSGRDKPWVAIGPRRSGPGETMYFITNHTVGTLPSGQHNTRCDDGFPLGQVWPQTEQPIGCCPPPAQGTPARADTVVVLSDPAPPSALRGRVFVGLGEFGGRPAWTFSDDSGLGGTWVYYPPQTIGGDLRFYHAIPGNLNPRLGDLSGNEVRPGVKPTAFPSACVSTIDGKTVLMTFPGIDETTPNDVDIFIAVSIDGGATFDATRIYRLQDWQLFAPNESPVLTTQAQPVVLMDSQGGVNFIYVNARDPDVTDAATRVTVRFAHFASISALTGAAQYVRDPSPLFPLTNDFKIGLNHNDYPALAGVECVLYAFYGRTPTNAGPDGVGSIFVRRIDLGACAIADVDGNLSVNPIDAAAFVNALVGATPPADVNLDGVINSQDGVDFLAAYSAAGGPP